MQNRTRRHNAPHAAEQAAALICRSSVGGKFDRYLLRPEAALGSGFSLQAAFWYQNAMLALFLLRKKSLKRSLSLLSPFRTPHKIESFYTLDSVVAILVAMEI